MLSRRALVGKIAAGAAGTAVALAVGGGRVSAAAREKANAPEDTGHAPALGATPESNQPSSSAKPSEPPPWDLVHPLAAGSAVTREWRVADLSGIEDGSCVLTLRNGKGREHRIHLCRNDGDPRGLVHTQQLDLLVMNGGQGDLPTEEGLAQAVAAVAHVLAANETRKPDVLAALLPQDERVRLFAGPVGRRLR